MKKSDNSSFVCNSCELISSFHLLLVIDNGEKEAAGLSNSDWLNFWGSYAGSILALMGALIAVIYSNHNSERAIQ